MSREGKVFTVVPYTFRHHQFHNPAIAALCACTRFLMVTELLKFRPTKPLEFIENIISLFKIILFSSNV